MADTNTTAVVPSGLIDEHPSTTLHKVRHLLLLCMSVDWDSPMNGADEGQQIIFDEMLTALSHTIEVLDGTLGAES